MTETKTTPDRVRAHSPKKSNERIDRNIKSSVKHFSGREDEIDTRLQELDREWDIERVLETNAATLALAGVALGAFVSRRWLVLTGVVSAFLLQHGLQGWCPPVPLIRRLGIRTRREIDREKQALKALRGDFEDVNRPQRSSTRAKRALQAVRDRTK